MRCLVCPQDDSNCKKCPLCTKGLPQSHHVRVSQNKYPPWSANQPPDSDERWRGLLFHLCQSASGEISPWNGYFHPASGVLASLRKTKTTWVHTVSNTSLPPLFCFPYFSSLPHHPPHNLQAPIQSSFLRRCGVCDTISRAQRVISAAVIK